MTPSWDTLFVCGILCNVLVCLAVRIGFAARSVSDKVLGILLPIAGFVAMGFEHCVANMFFLPMGLVAKTFGFGADAAGSITCPQPRSAISSAALIRDLTDYLADTGELPEFERLTLSLIQERERRKKQELIQRFADRNLPEAEGDLSDEEILAQARMERFGGRDETAV